MSVVLLLAQLAAAADHYDPSALAGASRVFAEASEVSAPRFTAAQRDSSALADGLNAWAENLDLLGARAPADERTALDAATRAFGREQAVVGAFAQGLADGYDAAFQAAVARALRGREADACSARGVRTMPGRASRADCPGQDLSAELAAAVDADPALRAALADLNARPWPAFTAPTAVGARVGPEGAPLFDLHAVARAHVGAQLDRVARADEEARLPIHAALEQGATGPQLDALRQQADAIDAKTAAARQGLFTALWSRWDKDAAKGRAGAAWCPRPEVVGGCGAPLTDPATLPAAYGALLDRAAR